MTIQKIVDGDVLVQPQKVARLWFPQFTDHTTPPHQDFVHFQGDFDTYTCWTPVGDCPIELGGIGDTSWITQTRGPCSIITSPWAPAD